MKVVTLAGTRPEIIRLSRVITRFDQEFDHILVHSGQNWDRQLKDVFFDELGLRRPDFDLQVDASSLASVLAGVFVGVEAVVRDVKPDAFLVLGDTNTALGLLVAKRMGVPTYHMEAGNRCFDENVPEETNRRVVDHTADFNLVYSEAARRNLLREGFHARRLFLTGSPLKEVFDHYRPQIDASLILDKLDLEPKRFILVSAHREETVDNPRRLRSLVDQLAEISRDLQLKVVVSVHPRTRRRLNEVGADLDAGGILWLPPFGFFDYNNLQLNASCILSDSGSISEETDILGLQSLTLRASMERPEALEAGVIVMHDVGHPNLAQSVAALTSRPPATGRVPEYQIADTSRRVATVVSSTAALHGFWAGIRDHELEGNAVESV